MSEDKHFDMLKGIQHIVTLPHNHIFKNLFFIFQSMYTHHHSQYS